MSVKVGGGFEPLEAFFEKHDPCRGLWICMYYVDYINHGKQLNAQYMLYIYLRRRSDEVNLQ